MRFEADPHAFNIWLSLPARVSRAELRGRVTGHDIGLMPSDAFTVLGAPDEHVRVCLGGSIGRDGLRKGLSFRANTLNGDVWQG